VEAGQVLISVQDSGVGIDPSKHKTLFDRFHQVDRKTMEQQGVGLGLAIAARLVRLHGGDIQVHSTPGVGSIFTIVLPSP
jgi:two-component system phosphate regulon sensor histidine kinase PhoR